MVILEGILTNSTRFSATINSRYSGHPRDRHLVFVIEGGIGFFGFPA